MYILSRDKQIEWLEQRVMAAQVAKHTSFVETAFEWLIDTLMGWGMKDSDTILIKKTVFKKSAV